MTSIGRVPEVIALVAVGNGQGLAGMQGTFSQGSGAFECSWRTRKIVTYPIVF